MTAPCERHRPGPAARAAARLGGRLPVLDTRRLQLRAPRIYDFDAYAAILMSDRAALMGGPYTRAQAWGAFTSHTALWLLHGHGLWTIDAETRPSAGFILLGYDHDTPEAELRVILSADAEGQGYATEAMEAARGHAFGDLGWDSVVSCVTKPNARARALMRRLGAKRDAAAEESLGDAELCVYRHRPEVA
ncbi:MAG TPA: N-acetyltransferase [Citreicella sp.]|jgi:RimJ/RimL family protein N-acetyltransferase|uniref:GNAT family N-acetyltransferase n=1 Tax=Salipiger marinus TaxID=555512 RepID=UPI000E7D5C2F|nr:N-acetyltransferase [Citreicella sp.]HBT02261.1 N-acetyltransferase [Citreicella sp.]|tara:strand:+ start:115 stop:687 length:573 start_codon:yes stop_codon:yes gene_type:complete